MRVPEGWRGVELVRRLAGGARSEVFLARRGERYVVVRRSRRCAAALRWEIELVEHLHANGVSVPVPLASDDGRQQVGGVVVSPFVEGRPPHDLRDWRRVAAVLGEVHELTRGRAQRPGFASARRLLRVGRGGDVDLDRMPVQAVAAVRAAWRPVLVGEECVVHGDAGPGNILVGDTVTLLDWDEARVDVPWFDYASVPERAGPDTPVSRAAIHAAGVAWEAATCWGAEPGYAARRLEELRSLRDRSG